MSLRKKLDFKPFYNDYFFRSFSLNNLLLGTFTKRGNKLKANNRWLSLKYLVKQEIEFDPNLVIFSAFHELSPQIILAMINMGGSRYGVPLPIYQSKKIQFALKWLKEESLIKKKINILKFSKSILSVHNLTNESLKKRDLLHNVAAENRYLVRFFK